MALSVGTGGGPVMLGSGMGGLGNSGAQSPPATILGLPMYISEKAPDLGTAGCVSLVNLDYYLIGDRQMMDLQVSDQFKFSTDKTAFRLIERVDGRPWIQSALTPHNNSSSTLSPFVQLAAI
jgi:HK97 family phage major capsid protein